MQKKNIHNGYEYVDLGLPSGTLWATENFGNSSLYSFDNKEEIDSFASNHIGGAWKIPTKEQFDELINNTISVWGKNYSGLSGKWFISKLNRNYIFFPSYGFSYEGKIYDKDVLGCYLSSSIANEDIGHKLCHKTYSFTDNGAYEDWLPFRWGCSVRAVANKVVTKAELFRKDAREIADKVKHLKEDIAIFGDNYNLDKRNIIDIIKILNSGEK